MKLQLAIFISFITITLSCQKVANVDTDSRIVAQIPTIITTSASTNIVSFTSGGTISNNGEDSILSKGIVWNTSPNPTIAVSPKTMNGSGNGTFISVADNLNSGTTYYYRAYAINSAGVGYGNELTLTTLSPDVYIAGSGFNSPYFSTVWKNGLATALTTGTSSISFSLFVKDSDVYVGGSVSTANGFDAVIWKNGLISYLPQGNGVNTFGVPANVGITSITVSGTDVYAAGRGSYLNNSGQTTPVARYWKNGTAVNIISPNKPSSFNGIAVSGNDVYVVGYIFTAGNDATVWKNGIPNTLVLGGSGVSGDASDIFIYNNDVYICGYSSVGNFSTPRLWKNNVDVPLSNPTGNGKAYGVTVLNDSVYVVGVSTSTTGTNDVATIWKNGIASYLPATGLNKNSYATDLKLLGSDVFISGIEVGTGARYWKNGIGNTLQASAPQGQGNAIFVK
jgi:hypothetical protein